MPKKQPDAESIDLSDDTPTERPQAEKPTDVHAHLAPVSEPKWNAATDDPDHPLHHHGKT